MAGENQARYRTFWLDEAMAAVDDLTDDFRPYQFSNGRRFKQGDPNAEPVDIREPEEEPDLF